MSSPPRILMLAGPNGAGKTTMGLAFAHIGELLNADEIAHSLAPLHPEGVALTASKLMVRRFLELLESRAPFAFETTAAGLNYVRHLKAAKDAGYTIELTYLWLASADLAVQRVAQRVARGGHNIPEDTIRRRYVLGIRNLLAHYLPLADSALIVDNTTHGALQPIAIKDSRGTLRIANHTTWEALQVNG